MVRGPVRRAWFDSTTTGEEQIMGILRGIMARAIRFGIDGLQGPEREEELRVLKSRLGLSKWSASFAWKSLAEANAKLDELLRRAHAAESEAAALRADRKAAVNRAEEADRLVAEYRARTAELEAPLPEATVEELDRAYRAGSGGFSGPATVFMNGGIRAVAERVRRERPPCLIARAVAANIDVRVAEDQGGGFLVVVHRAGEDEDVERNVPAAEVHAELARMLGEVGA